MTDINAQQSPEAKEPTGQPTSVEAESAKAQDAAASSGDQDSKPDEELNYFASAPLRSAQRLMDALYPDDSFYETTTLAWVGPEDARKLFLYGVCKEVSKVCISMLEDQDHLKEEVPDEKKPDRITKLVLGAFADSQTYLIRKMVELLITLILFDRNAARDEVYRVFLNAESLDMALTRLDDFRELYNERVIGNTKHSADGFADRIVEDLATLGVESLWFLNLDKLAKRKPSVFRSKRQLFLKALLVASPDERMALGISYGRGYSENSQAVHPLLGSHDYGRRENTVRSLRGHYIYLSLVSMHVMHLAHRLGGIEDPAGLDTILGKQFEKSAASSALRKFHQQFEPGDIVLTAWTDVAEILESVVGKYGYKAYRIKYLSRAPLPELPDDWMESQAILLRLMPKSAIRGLFEKNATAEDRPEELQKIMPEILKLPDEKLMQCAGRMFVDLHKAGVLIPMLLRDGHLKRAEL